MAKLKVYRTPIGFHDAYVAAPSQKAALAAWGTTTNLFARGVAEVVEDPALTAEPLAHPGEVIKRTRGGLAEQLAALPPDTPAKPAKQTPARPAPVAKTAKLPPKPKPRPSRAALDKAEAALTAAEARHAEEASALAAEEAALAKRRKAMADAQAKEHARLNAAAERARSSYEAALERWRAE